MSDTVLLAFFLSQPQFVMNMSSVSVVLPVPECPKNRIRTGQCGSIVRSLSLSRAHPTPAPMRAWECGSMVECLPGALKTLCSIPSTEKKKREEKENIKTNQAANQSLWHLWLSMTHCEPRLSKNKSPCWLWIPVCHLWVEKHVGSSYDCQQL